MQDSIYRATERAKRHLTTVLIALVVSVLAGGGSAIAARHLTFGQISGKLNGAQITKGTVEEDRLSYPLQHFIENCREDCASNSAEDERRWEEDIDQAVSRLESRIKAEYVHK